MYTPWTVSTIPNGAFISLTLNIVQPNSATSLTEPGTLWSTNSRRIPKLTTDNSRIIYIPVIVTNRSPASSVIDLHSALSRPASPNQSQTWWCVITKKIFICIRGFFCVTIWLRTRIIIFSTPRPSIFTLIDCASIIFGSITFICFPKKRPASMIYTFG